MTKQEPMEYPRPLRPKERDLLGTVLPADRSGYARYRERIGAMLVLAQGAFLAYNRLKRRVAISQDPPALQDRGLGSHLKNLFVRSR